MTRRAWQYVGLSFAMSWLLGFGFWGFGGKLTGGVAIALGVVYMYMPALAAFLLQRRYREPVVALGIRFKPNRWFAIGWVLPALASLLALAVGLLMPGVSFSPGMEGMLDRFRDTLPPEQLEQVRQQVDSLPVHPFWLGLVQSLLAGVTLNAVAAFGEELGWRGFLQREVGGRLGFWRASLLIGVIWGVWHAPLILQGHNYPQHPVVGVAMMVCLTVLVSPLLSIVRLRSGSVVAAAIFHGTFNASAGTALILLKGGNDLLIGLPGLAGLLAIAFLDLLLFVYLRLRPEAAQPPALAPSPP